MAVDRPDAERQYRLPAVRLAFKASHALAKRCDGGYGNRRVHTFYNFILYHQVLYLFSFCPRVNRRCRPIKGAGNGDVVADAGDHVLEDAAAWDVEQRPRPAISKTYHRVRLSAGRRYAPLVRISIYQARSLSLKGPPRGSALKGELLHTPTEPPRTGAGSPRCRSASAGRLRCQGAGSCARRRPARSGNAGPRSGSDSPGR